ncbi:M57 family metalloprotease [Paraflavisolibacter sp. H34]|uniref:M57 family metalloprotease n=1 Tax=Huijunlia imazamoxiresistens TaxID=3127457 RepID=UPI003017A87C
MTKFNLSVTKVALILALFATFQSCKKSDVQDVTPATESIDIAALQQSVSNSLGAPEGSVVYNKELKQFVVEEDSYVSLEDAQLRFGNKGIASGVNGTTQREHFYLIVPTKVKAITIFADATVPAAWLTALDSAIASWNRTGSAVQMKRVTSATGATTKVTTNYTASSTIASAAYPDYYGNPGSRMTINTYQNGLTASKKRFAITHELGHTIGFGHTNSTWGYAIEGTPTTDSYSVMNSTVLNWSNFTSWDLLAVKTLYPKS